MQICPPTNSTRNSLFPGGSAWDFTCEHFNHNRPVAQSHDAPVPYPTMQDVVKEMSTYVPILLQNGAVWDMK